MSSGGRRPAGDPPLGDWADTVAWVSAIVGTGILSNRGDALFVAAAEWLRERAPRVQLPEDPSGDRYHAVAELAKQATRDRLEQLGRPAAPRLRVMGMQYTPTTVEVQVRGRLVKSMVTIPLEDVRPETVRIHLQYTDGPLVGYLDPER